MNWDALGAIAELLGAIAVFLTLAATHATSARREVVTKYARIVVYL